MPVICKPIPVVGGAIDKNCCGCQDNASPYDPIIDLDYSARDILFEYSPTQYMVAIDVLCGCEMHPHVPPLKVASTPHSIRVVSANNPANVSFLISNSLGVLSRTTAGGRTYNGNRSGVFMIVDKNPNEVEIPKSSTIQIGIKACANSIEVLQTINTEWFFNNNLAKYFWTVCNNSSGVASIIWPGQPLAGEYVNHNCKEDAGTHWKLPIAYKGGCFNTGSNPAIRENSVGRTMQNLTVVGELIGGSNTLTPTTVTAQYDTSVGVWFLHVLKTYTIPAGGVSLVIEIDILGLNVDDPCGVGSIHVNPTLPIYNRPDYKLVTKKLVSNSQTPLTAGGGHITTGINLSLPIC